MTRKAWFLIGMLILAHLLIDICVPHLFLGFHREWLLVLLLGICVAQVNLIGVWAALAPGRLILRLLWSTFLATLMWYALVLGNRLDWNGVSWTLREYFRRPEALQLGVVLFTGVLLAQVPLWIAARVSSWRLLPPCAKDSSGNNERQFKIGHLLVAMAVVSLALALGRIVLPDGEWRVAQLERELYALLPAVALVNLAVAVPCVWGAFARQQWIGPFVFAWPFYAGLVTIVEVALLSAILGPPPGEVWMQMLLFNILQCVCVFVTLLTLRAAGFRLVRLDGSTSPSARHGPVW